MGHEDRSSTGAQSEQANGRKPRNVRRDLLMGLGAFAAFIVVSLGLFTAFNPSMRWALTSSLASTRGEAPLELVVLHTNDTWGYMLPCG